jgi:hypothetical protein
MYAESGGELVQRSYGTRLHRVVDVCGRAGYGLVGRLTTPEALSPAVIFRSARPEKCIVRLPPIFPNSKKLSGIRGQMARTARLH